MTLTWSEKINTNVESDADNSCFHLLLKNGLQFDYYSLVPDDVGTYHKYHNCG